MVKIGITLGNILIYMCFASAVTAASMHRYQAAMDQSTWSVAPAQPLQCKMQQTIPLYGTASFIQNAGEMPIFELEVLQPPPTTASAELLSMPPQWLHDSNYKSLAELAIEPARTAVRLKAKTARLMLSELELGWYPTISHADYHGNSERIMVSLSAINFQPAFKEYLLCLQQLLPYGFADVRLSTLYYGPGKTLPSTKDSDRLQQLKTYLAVDPSIRRVVIKSYTDSMGSRRNNYLISIKRLRAVEQFFLDHGYDEKKIDATAFGERDPVTSNKTAKGRSLNRRLTIQLVR